MKKDYIEKAFTCHIMHCSNEHLSFCFSHLHLPVCQVFYLNLNVTIVGLTLHNRDRRFAKSFTQTWMLNVTSVTSLQTALTDSGFIPRHFAVGSSFSQVMPMSCTLTPARLPHSWVHGPRWHALELAELSKGWACGCSAHNSISLLWQSCSIEFLLVLSLLNLTTAEKQDSSLTGNKMELRK